ncbi:MAG: prenyltransferase/squalene oxidase repeat-containing protein [Anaerohalosphaeraceae bacterium]
MNELLKKQLESVYQAQVTLLLAERNTSGFWEGRLSSSPLATAVAVFALFKVNPEQFCNPIEKGLEWLSRTQNPDGGWGDTDGADPSNLSTTLLCRAAFYGCRAIGRYELTLNKAERWIGAKVGSLDPKAVVEAVYHAYGQDRTFAVPILTMCALAECLGAKGWSYIAALPFELAIFPRRIFRWLNLSVVSYALPALIAMGQAKLYFAPPGNPVLRWIRGAVRQKTLRFLEQLQPSNGGFLEAAPLTAFVTMCLAAIGHAGHPIAQKGAEFLLRSVRADGSWPIDTNLATWVTTLAVKAFGDATEKTISGPERNQLVDWLLGQQFGQVHPFTGSAPGGWGWTDQPGAVPDADDTAGSLVALYYLDREQPAVGAAAQQGIKWLLSLQNRDGGIPTFCRGWGKLPFDRSCPDITAHAVQAWSLWRELLPLSLQKRLNCAIAKAVNYLADHQRKDGAWLPLWFGNPFGREQANPVYGTAQVVDALLNRNQTVDSSVQKMVTPSIKWLLSEQKQDGSWGAGTVGTAEETALVVKTLVSALGYFPTFHAEIHQAIEKGLGWMMDSKRKPDKAAPIGLYFAKLWYYERLYRSIFTISAYRKAGD